jgi:hypothetical protein
MFSHLSDEVWFNARPHPSLLPRGEGESLAVSPENLRLGGASGHRVISGLTEAVPSPGGEGQGEGGLPNSLEILVLQPAEIFEGFRPPNPHDWLKAQFL